MPAPSTAMWRNPARVQHLPGDGGPQPLLGAVRAGRQTVSTRLYPSAVVSWPTTRGGQPHAGLAGKGRPGYDWQHYIPLVQSKPGALRNGAPFADLPAAPLARLRQALLRHAGGDRLMAQVLALSAAPRAGRRAGGAELALEQRPPAVGSARARAQRAGPAHRGAGATAERRHATERTRVQADTAPLRPALRQLPSRRPTMRDVIAPPN